MAKPFSISLPPDHWLTGDYIIRVIAVDPDTGIEETGVDIQNVTMQVEQGAGGNLSTAQFKATPILVRQQQA